MIQLNRKEAIKIYDNEYCLNMSNREIFVFQISQDKLCIPFEVFQKSAQIALGRPVFTHEFANPQSLLTEFFLKIKKS